ncbi:MAG: lysophospholipid acyltransferase family protein [Candidatus Saganbacteria bacterium]|nr:lysophospholipid acyltransferase family protein [Candidatus Saganbacteria bacterium]
MRLLQLFFRVIFFLPARLALSIMYFCAATLAAIAKKTKFRKTVVNNVAMVLPEANAEQVADNLISNISCTIFEVLCAPFFKRKHFDLTFKIQGKDILDKAISENQGAIILTMHIGNYETIANALANLDYKMDVILKATEDPIFKIINRSRASGGIKLINVVEEDMFKKAIEALRQGEIIAVLADTGALDSRHEFMNFLGKKVPVAVGWITLAQRAKCPVLPCLIRREGRLNIATCFDAIQIRPSNRAEAMQKIGKYFEDFIIKYPEEWGMFLNSYETKRMLDSENQDEQKH